VRIKSEHREVRMKSEYGEVKIKVRIKSEDKE
jgi:hypothetical protein